MIVRPGSLHADGRRMRLATRITIQLAAVAAVLGVLPAGLALASPVAPTLFGLDVPSLAQFDATTAAVGARPAIAGIYADWAHTPDFPARFAGEAASRGAVTLISWEPWDSWQGGAEQPGYALRRIVAGAFDPLIDRWAAEIARYRRPVLIRFAPEMNGDWLPWSTGVNGNRPGDFVAAWRHVRARFRRAGATNALWVWNPIAAYEGSTPLPQLFPGSGEVDWIGVDGHNWGDLREWGWQSYDDIFAPTIAAVATLAPGRPVMIAETACAPGPGRAAWVSETFADAHSAGIGAVVWFEFDKETDWRLAADPAAAAAARAAVSAPGWLHGGELRAVERQLARER